MAKIQYCFATSSATFEARATHEQYHRRDGSRHRLGGTAARAPLIVAPADHDLTVIIPAYNEEKRLPWTLAELTAFLDDWGIDYRVLVADDGSTDRTAALTRQPRAALLDAPHLAPGRQGPGRADRHAPGHRPRAGLHRRRSPLPTDRPAAGLRVDPPRRVRRGLRRPRHRGRRATWPRGGWPAGWPRSPSARSSAGWSRAK